MLACQAVCKLLSWVFMLGERIKAARKSRQLNHEQLADLLEGSKQTVMDWEAGRRTPPVDRLQEIARVLGKRVSWFFGESEGDPEPVFETPIPAPGKALSERSLLQLLEKQQDLLSRQQTDVSRLTELLARQQEAHIADREFARQFAHDQVERLQGEIVALRRELEAFRAAGAGDQVEGFQERLEAARKVIDKTLPPDAKPKTREAGAASAKG